MNKTVFKKRKAAKATNKGAARLAKQKKLENMPIMAAHVYEERRKEEDARRRATERGESSYSGLL